MPHNHLLRRRTVVLPGPSSRLILSHISIPLAIWKLHPSKLQSRISSQTPKPHILSNKKQSRILSKQNKAQSLSVRTLARHQPRRRRLLLLLRQQLERRDLVNRDLRLELRDLCLERRHLLP